MLLHRKLPRRGAVLIESALVYPVVFMIMLGIILLGIAVFQNQRRQQSNLGVIGPAAYGSARGADSSSRPRNRGNATSRL